MNATYRFSTIILYFMFGCLVSLLVPKSAPPILRDSLDPKTIAFKQSAPKPCTGEDDGACVHSHNCRMNFTSIPGPPPSSQLKDGA